MIKNEFAFIANYICKESVKNLNNQLTEAELRKFNHSDYYFLTTIYNLGKPSFSFVGKELGISKYSVSVTAKKLINMKLIDKTQSNEDKRIYYLNLTDRGKKIIDGDEKLYESLSKMMKDILKDEEKYILVNALMDELVEKLKVSEGRAGNEET